MEETPVYFIGCSRQIQITCLVKTKPYSVVAFLYPFISNVKTLLILLIFSYYEVGHPQMVYLLRGNVVG